MALKISPSWLKSFCHLNASTEEIADMLSQTGFETEVINDIAIDPMLVVGHIDRIEPHPNADKLNICHVNIGSEALQIVCGCPTVIHAKHVIVAPINAKLPGMTLKPVTLRGIDSQGMICSLKEIGLSEEGSGIYHLSEPVEVGTKLVELIHHDEKILEIDVTPNRGDCLSVYGVARDLAASQGVKLEPYPNGEDLSRYEHTDTLFKVNSKNTVAYDALSGSFNPKSSTPLFMINRLRQAGMGTNHVVVDILNYVMLEIGQPMHAFNAAAISLPLRIDESGSDAFKLLDDSMYEPKSWDTVISDQNATHALAGIMGGYDSRMQPDSTDLQLESAIFNPSGIAKSLRNCKLGSDASYRYERGVCPYLNQIALSYTAKLLQTYTNATFTSHQSYHTKPTNNGIIFDINWANSYLGTDLSPEAMTGHLQQLGMNVNQNSDSIHISPPSYRYDIQVAQDLVEEVARLHGYNNIPLEPMHGHMTPKLLVVPTSESAKTFIVHHGYHEVVQFSFVPKSLIELFPNECEAIEISNPINSEFSYMRTNVLQSLVMAAQHNYQRQMKQFKLFEVGQSFQLINNKILEQTQLAAICVGNSARGYGNRVCTVDYYDMQSLALGLLAKHGMESITITDSLHPALHPKQSCRLMYQGSVVGEVGVLHPATSKALSLPEAALLILHLDQVDTLSSQSKTIDPTSKYPSITRDITFVVSSNTKASDISEALVQAQIPHLIKMSVVDVYTPDSHLESKSITWSLSFQSHDKTLTDKEIESAMQDVRKEAGRFTQAHK